MVTYSGFTSTSLPTDLVVGFAQVWAQAPAQLPFALTPVSKISNLGIVKIGMIILSPPWVGGRS